MTLQGRIFIARHGETVFNAASRMQGQANIHTPLTRTGFAQADQMGKALAKWLGTRQTLSLWSSTAGRALQTMAVMAEHLGENYHHIEQDERLQEIDVGDWSDRTYADIAKETPDFLDQDARLFAVRPPNGEWYDEIATRLNNWIDDTREERGDRLVVMHGISSRVLRGVLQGLPVNPCFGAPIADNLPQGSLVMIGGGTEKVIHLGGGVSHA
ncbi:MAG: histidine phosphatase family protein [Sphingomonadaceae bacterium]